MVRHYGPTRANVCKYQCTFDGCDARPYSQMGRARSHVNAAHFDGKAPSSVVSQYIEMTFPNMDAGTMLFDSDEKQATFEAMVKRIVRDYVNELRDRVNSATGVMEFEGRFEVKDVGGEHIVLVRDDSGKLHNVSNIMGYMLGQGTRIRMTVDVVK